MISFTQNIGHAQQAARAALDEFGRIWDSKYPMIYQSRVAHWEELSEFFKYPPEIRRAIYTTNAVESLNYQVRKVTKNRSSFSTDDAILKIPHKILIKYPLKNHTVVET